MSVWLLGLVGRRLRRSTCSDTLDAQERSADYIWKSHNRGTLEEPCSKFLKILNMGSISPSEHEINFFENPNT